VAKSNIHIILGLFKFIITIRKKYALRLLLGCFLIIYGPILGAFFSTFDILVDRERKEKDEDKE